MILANFLVRIEIPDWMTEAEQDAMLEALERSKLPKHLEASTRRVLAKTKRLNLGEVKVQE